MRVSKAYVNRPFLFFCNFLLLICFSYGQKLLAQDRQSLDRVIAVIDEEVVLESDLRNQYDYLMKNGQRDAGDLRCRIFEQLLTSKLLLARARIDSVVVTEGQIEDELNRRISTLLSQVSSEEALVEIYGKSMVEMRMDLRPIIQEELLIEGQKRSIMEGVEVTPREVRKFFNDIPKDSLPFFPSEVELSHIVMRPEPSDASKQAARDKLREVRERIMKGELTFSEAASRYSQDYGTAKLGGSLGEFGRGEMVPEFEEVVFTLEEAGLSTVFESPFGFHIVKLINRNGETAEAAHVLLRPSIDPADEQLALKKLASLRRRILADSLTFEEAAREASADPMTKDNGGRILSKSGDYRVPLDQLDADLYLKIDNMKVGEITEPIEFIYGQGQLSKAWRIVYLHRKWVPHQANLKDDYPKFQQGAKQSQQAKVLEEWFKKTKEQIFIELKANDCAQALENWY